LLVVWCAGTQKQHVTQDYEQWIHVGMVKAATKLLQGLQQLAFPAASVAAAESVAVQPASGVIFKRKLSQTRKPLQPAAGASKAFNSNTTDVVRPAPLLSMCLNLNSSLCSSSVALSAGDGFLLVVYNPIAQAYSWGVRVPVAAGSYSVTALDGKPVQSQLLPLSAGTGLIWPSSASAKEAPNKPGADLALLVAAPALGHTVYRVTRLKAKDSTSADNSTTAVSEVIQMATNSSKIFLSGGRLQAEVMAAGITAVTFAGRRVNYSSSLIKYQGR
jgi:hypothetical protein